MKFATVCCLILAPLVSARYIDRVFDDELSSEIESEEQSRSVADAVIVNSKRDFDDFEGIELNIRAKIAPASRAVYLEIARRYAVFYELFHKTDLDLDDFMCNSSDEGLQDAVKANKDLYATWESLTSLMNKHNLIPKEMFCY